MTTQESPKLSIRGKLALFALLIMIGLIYSSGVEPVDNSIEEAILAPEKIEELVSFVIDGDTIMLEGSEKVRLIGIDAPERGEDGYEEAREALEGLVLNKRVTLVPQQSDRDTYGRLLRDVYVADTFVNLYLVEHGFATALPIEPDTAFARELYDAEKAAEETAQK